MFNRLPLTGQEHKVKTMHNHLNDLLRRQMYADPTLPPDTGDTPSSKQVFEYIDALKAEETKMMRMQIAYPLWGWLLW